MKGKLTKSFLLSPLDYNETLPKILVLLSTMFIFIPREYEAAGEMRTSFPTVS